MLGSYEQVPAVSGNQRANLKGQSVEDYVDACVVWGSPARVRDQVARLKATFPLEYLMIAPLSEESFRLFVSDVVPAL